MNIVYGCAYFWIIVAALAQKRFLTGAILIAMAVGAKFAKKLWIDNSLSIRDFAKWIVIPAALCVWIHTFGTYSLPRDCVAILLATVLVTAAFKTTREAVDNVLRNKKKIPSSPVTIRFCIHWLLISWLLVSLADYVLESRPLEKGGNVVTPANMPPEWRNLRVGLALSGGGYRAALVHAGVLSELANLGVPITHMSSVSGGSIIASYIATGGDPQTFVKAVTGNRFRLTRDLTWTWNVFSLAAPLRIPVLDLALLPVKGSTRVDIQASLFDRVLLNGIRTQDPIDGVLPQLIINATDLRYGLTVGFMRTGILISGPVTMNKVVQSHLEKNKNIYREECKCRSEVEIPPMSVQDLPPAFFADRSSPRTEVLPRLAQRVAVSGAFPGAFPPTEVSLSIPGRELALSLADGGVRDNLGVNSLLVANFLSRRQGSSISNTAPVRDRMSENWSLDFIIASDGGQATQTPHNISAFESIFRAIDLAGLETGPVRFLPVGSPPNIEVLTSVSTFTFSPDLIVSGVSPDRFETSPEGFFGVASIDDASLIYMARLIPDQRQVAHLIKNFEDAQKEWIQKGGAAIPMSCNSSSSDFTERFGCARSVLVMAIGADIWRSLQTFRTSETLKDDYTPEAADDLVRYGRYLVRFHWNSIKDQLSAAAQRK